MSARTDVAPGQSGDLAQLDLLVAGHVNVDHFLRVARLPAVDRTVPLLREKTELGGTATTLARVAVRAGLRVGLIARVGADFPPEYLARLTAEGVSVDGVDSVGGARSPSCYIVEDERSRQFTLIHQGPMGDTRGALLPNALLARSPWLHLSTGEPSYQLRLRGAARERGLHLAVDPAQEIHYRWGAAPFRRLVEGAEILFGNEAEVRRAMQLLRTSSPRDLLRFVPLVIVTRGARGARALTRVGSIEVAAHPVGRPHQVTGAGDAFRGGFYGAYLTGAPLREALKAGTRMAASWIRHGGFPTRRGDRR